MSERERYDPSGLPYVVTWLRRELVDEDGLPEDHDVAFGPFPSYSSAAEFVANLKRTDDRVGYVLQVLYPPEDYALR